MRRGLLVFVCVVACRVEPTPTPAPAPAASHVLMASAITSPSVPAPDPAPSAAPSSSSSASPLASSLPTSLPPDHWCTEGLAALDDETCVFIPDAPATPRSLLIYLHGVVAPTGRMQRIYQSVVLARARARGFVAMMPRGRRGIGPKNVKDWYAWPTSADAHVRFSKSIVDSILDRKRRLEAIVGAPFERTYLAGSSNGAYYVAILAFKGEIAVDGFGAMSGGGARGRSKATMVASPRPPFYVGWGTNDDTNGDPKSLAALLVSVGWPSKSAEHPVGHGAREIYIDEAFDYWQARRER